MGSWSRFLSRRVDSLGSGEGKRSVGRAVRGRKEKKRTLSRAAAARVGASTGGRVRACRVSVSSWDGEWRADKSWEWNRGFWSNMARPRGCSQEEDVSPLLQSLPPQRGITEVTLACSCPLSSFSSCSPGLVGGSKHSLWLDDPGPEPKSHGQARLAVSLSLQDIHCFVVFTPLCL